MPEFSPRNFTYVDMSEEGALFTGELMAILAAIFAIVGAVAVVYAIYLGFLLAKAEDEGKRTEAKKRIHHTLAGLFIIVILVSVFGSIAGGLWEGTRNRASIGAYRITVGGIVRNYISLEESAQPLGYMKVNSSAPTPAQVVYYKDLIPSPSGTIDPSAELTITTSVKGAFNGESIIIAAYFLNNKREVLDYHQLTVLVTTPSATPKPYEIKSGTTGGVVAPKPGAPGYGTVPPGTGGVDIIENIRWPFNNDNGHTANYDKFWGASRNHKNGETYHLGIDVFRPAGTPVYAIASGVVSFIGTNSASIQIKHPDMVSIPLLGSYHIWSFYIHMDIEPDMRKGVLVAKGQLLGWLAPRGPKTDDTDPHLHLEISTNGDFSFPDMAFVKNWAQKDRHPTVKQLETATNHLHPMRLYNPPHVFSIENQKCRSF